MEMIFQPYKKQNRDRVFYMKFCWKLFATNDIMNKDDFAAGSPPRSFLKKKITIGECF